MTAIHTFINSDNWTFWPAKKDIATLPSSLNIYKFYSAIFLFLLVFAALTNISFLNNDLWQDELYTLDNFVLVPVTRTLTDYHTTNNHIVFNFVANIYLKIIQTDNLGDLLDNPLLIRILPYLFTLISVPAFYYGARKMQGPLFAVIALSIYVSSLQLYTFGSQVRGYSLELLLCIIMTNLLLSYHRHPSLKYLAYITVAGSLLLINLPSTIYFFISLLALVFLSAVYSSKIIKWNLLVRSADFKLFIALSGAFLLFAIFFIFKKEQIAKLGYLFSSRNSISDRIRLPIAVYYRFIDWRIILLLPVGYLIMQPLSFTKKNVSLLLAGLLIIPFTVYFFHNPPSILRIWLVILPVFCLFMAQLCLPLFMVKSRLLIPFIGLLLLSLLLSMNYLKKQTYANNTRNFAATDLRYQYHLFGFNPKEITGKLEGKFRGDSIRAILYDPSAFGMSYYLRDKNLLPTDSLRSYRGKIFLIADRFNCFEKMVIPRENIIDSGKNNSIHFFKWYLLNKK
ncbi:MAG: hypothetical protein ABI687_03550 [Flavitalea sp.]